VNNKALAAVALLTLILSACSKSSQPQKTAATPPATPVAPNAASPNATAPVAAPVATAAPARGVKTEMRNVLFHLSDRAAAHLEVLSGELWPTGKNEMPVFDDKNSFEVHVTSGKVSISPQALASILNNHVFARSDAPLKDLSITIENQSMRIKGKLHSKGDIPFETTGTLSVNPDGRIRVKTEKVKALHVPMKGVMGVFGIELADVVNTSQIAGLDTAKNDLLMDLGTLLPPPHIRGKVTAVKLENDAIVTYFGDGGASLPPPTETGSYMKFEGNPVRFGKMTMESADLVVLDMDASGTLDWSQDHYRDQLVAGYSKITPAFGLRAYVKDFGKLPRTPDPASAPPATPAQPPTPAAPGKS